MRSTGRPRPSTPATRDGPTPPSCAGSVTACPGWYCGKTTALSRKLFSGCPSPSRPRRRLRRTSPRSISTGTISYPVPAWWTTLPSGATTSERPLPSLPGAVHVDEVALVDRGIGARDREFEFAVDRVGHGRMDHHLRAHPGERARRLREPHVVADRDAEPPDVRHVKDHEFRAGRDALLVRQEREHLAVARDDFAARDRSRASCCRC